MGTSTRYSAEVRERAVRIVAEHLHEYSSQWAAIASTAAKIGSSMPPEWLHQIPHWIEPLARIGRKRVTMRRCQWDPLESTCRHASLSIL